MIPIIYNENYNYYAPPFFPHPFNPSKSEQILNKLTSINNGLHLFCSNKMIEYKDIIKVHNPNYLDNLNGKYLSKVIDFPGLLTYCPQKLINSCLLDPMRWQTSGTILATKKAFQFGSAINLGGGYHHARKNKGWGGCIYADIPLAIELECQGKIVAIVDLDAHQGDGLEEYVLSKNNVYIMDMFNQNEFPNNPDGLLNFATRDANNIKKHKILEVPLRGGHLEQELLNRNSIFGIPLEKLDPLYLTECVKLITHTEKEVNRLTKPFRNDERPPYQKSDPIECPSCNHKVVKKGRNKKEDWNQA